MFPYWILFGVPALASMMERPQRLIASRRSAPIVAALAVFAIMIGFRYRVGGDWRTYLDMLAEVNLSGFASMSATVDPGYVFVNLITGYLNADIWLTNLICGALFCSGLYRLTTTLRRPWLALVVAVPYLVIVVAMGYTRQAVAIGLTMHALVALGDRSKVKFVIWVLLAATFHKTAVVLIPIAALIEQRGRIWTAFWISAAAAIAFWTLLEQSVDTLVSGYLESGYDSAGAAIRVAINTLPAVLFLAFRKRFQMDGQERRLYTALALIAVVLVPVLIVSPSSTAVDRMALYLIPLQLVILSSLPEALGRSPSSASLISLGVMIYSAAIQFTWLNFADNAGYWVPYSFFPI